MIGLSGLITPSLDEMVHVAREMQRLKFDLPLLIGGATTSPAHTAVKIEPNYEGPVIYVKDASRSVGVAQALVEKDTRAELIERTRADNARRRERHAGKGRLAPQLAILEARANRRSIDWQTYEPPVPTFLGTRVFDNIELATLRDYMDWMPFFNAWEFHGTFPAILDDDVVGEAVRNLYDDAQAMLDRLIEEKWLQARAVVGFFAANSTDDDDIVVFTDDTRKVELARLHHLRQQRGKPPGQPQECLSDFVAPMDSARPDYVGAFAVTAGIGIDEHVARFEAEHDDYSSILLKALADRLAEALTEFLHERVRRELWAYAPDEEFANQDLIAEAYRGIRPAPGYPACPDHTEKGTLWKLLDVDKRIGLRLTESYAMVPTAAVSGFYFSHPESRYFSVGQISRDQAESLAQRKHAPITEIERWLAPNLGYDPE
jgi:5-methyltetrahydrofolate--homocysteine methyltransferase